MSTKMQLRKLLWPANISQVALFDDDVPAINFFRHPLNFLDFTCLKYL